MRGGVLNEHTGLIHFPDGSTLDPEDASEESEEPAMITWPASSPYESYDGMHLDNEVDDAGLNNLIGRLHLHENYKPDQHF